MKLKYISLIFLSALGLSSLAGNEDRVGSAGASELLINPWARSSAWGGAGISAVGGLEAVHLNVAGLAYADNTEVSFTNTSWLVGSGININSIGIAQRVGESNVLSLGFTSLDYGDIEITTAENPEGGLGTFSPSNTVIQLAYAREFSSSISGGITVKLINEGISNVRANGVAIDAGVRYTTGKYDNIKFGLALKNVGPPMSYSGDGLAFEAINPFSTADESFTFENRSAEFELPSLLNIGGSYDFIFDEKSRLTAALGFTSNSFSRDQYRVGAEYKYEHKLATVILRAGGVLEKGLFSAEERQTALTGPTGGISIDLPVSKKNKSTLGIDYTYRTSNPFGGVHSVGVRLNLASSSDE